MSFKNFRFYKPIFHFQYFKSIKLFRVYLFIFPLIIVSKLSYYKIDINVSNKI